VTNFIPDIFKGEPQGSLFDWGDFMKWYKCRDVEVGVEEIGYTQNQRMQIRYIVKLDGKIIAQDEDLESGCRLYNNLKQMADILVDFLVSDETISENRIEYDFSNEQETHYFLTEMEG
jgi:hypothetical protein